MTPHTPTAIRPAGARPAPLLPKTEAGGPSGTDEGGSRGKAPGRCGTKPRKGDSAKEDRTPGPPPKAAMGGRRARGSAGADSRGPRGHRPASPNDRCDAERPHPSSGRPTPPGGTQGGRPGSGQSPRACGGSGRARGGDCGGDARPRGRRAAGHGERYSKHRPAYPNDPRRRRASQPEQWPPDPSWRNARGEPRPGVDEAPGPCGGPGPAR
jgi:hypothetical protein